mmetsp:Transcript_70508/g.82138  ORF Transcript_70508/g.82138 Transcript_70508/m.82138 type:complete len:471 (+) Transcript_70508:1-1413(+)
MERSSTRHRIPLRRPPSGSPTPTASKHYSPVGGSTAVSQSFAAPLRPMTLQEFQELLRKLPLDDPTIEERIRTLCLSLNLEAYQTVEPIRLQSKSAKSFVEAILQLKQRTIRQGLGLSLDRFCKLIRGELETNSKEVNTATAESIPSLTADAQAQLEECLARLENLMRQLGPTARSAVSSIFTDRTSLDDFDHKLSSLTLRHERSTAFSRSYLSSVIDSLCDMDSATPHTPFFDVVQTDVTPKIRFILAEWLFDVSIRFKFCPETIFLALALTDRYMMVQRVARTEAQLVGIAALVIAAKYEEVYPPEMKDFVYMSADAFSAGEIIRMERQLFVRLQYGVTVATVNAIATSLLAEQDPSPTPTQAMLVQFMSTIMAVSTHLGQFSQAHLAAAIVHISRAWTSVVTEPASADVQRLFAIIINTMLAISPAAKMGATIANFYAQPAQLQVSTLPIPAVVLDLLEDQVTIKQS